MTNSSFKSRAGEKLFFALREFSLSVSGLTCADFGSNVGGFVGVLIDQGALKVYAVETGYGVLDWTLRNDPRVVVMERTNAMHVKLPELVDLITIDTSWTKQKNILPNSLANLKPNGRIITLIKPHYEAPELVKKGKLDPTLAADISRRLADDLSQELSLNLLNFTLSPVVGGKAANTEYIAHYQLA